MAECMTQDDAMNMNNEQAIKILKPFRDMMVDQHGCPISDAYFAMGKAIDALAQPEIIRCKECVDYDTSWIPHSAPDRHYCPTMDSMMPEDAYCSYAERRTDG